MTFDSRALQVSLLAAGLSGCAGANLVVVPTESAARRRPPAARIDVSRALSETAGAYTLEFVFREPEKAPLPIRFELDKRSYDAFDRAWGYKESDLKRLEESFKQARRGAFDAALARRGSQTGLDAELANLQASYEKAKRDYILSRGFKYLPDGRIEADLKALVRAEASRLAPLARALERAAAGGGRPGDWVVAAAAELVQTGLDYREVPPIIDAIHTGGVWPPAMTLVYGWGDCDTKAALLAAILSNLPGLHGLGIELSGHYLLGISRKPSKDDAAIRFQGRRYVLFEPAGPDRLPPGSIGEETKLFFRQGRPYSVELLF